MVLTRFALYVSLMLQFGLPTFLLYNRREAFVFEMLFARILRVLAILAPCISILGFALLCANMSGVALSDLDQTSVATIVLQTPIGAAWIARMAALLAYLALLLLPGPGHTGRAAALVVAGAAALGSLAWTGHGAAGDWLQLVADIVHLLAAALWVGALGAFVVLLVRLRTSPQSAGLLAVMLTRFAVIGSLAVTAIVASGAVNAWELVGPRHAIDIWNTTYGRILTIKLLVFIAMFSLAAANRFGLTPKLQRSLANARRDPAVSTLRTSVVIEAAFALTVLALVAYLGMLEPPTAAL